MASTGAILAAIARMRDRLRHPEALMPTIGRIVAQSCVRAFQLQRLGDIQWPARYPRQGGTKFNIAGALQDFIEGRTAPKANRFQDRPALVDTGSLRDSIEARIVDDFTVQVGSDHPRAALMQGGGTSVQSYGDDVKKRIRDWLFERKQEHDVRGRFTKKHQVARAGREPYVQYMNQMLHKSEHRTQIAARPFIGITDSAERSIKAAVKAHFEGRA